MMYECKFTPSVDCKDMAGCSRCGWNPDVALYRLKHRQPTEKKTVPDGANTEDGRPKGQI